MIYGSVCSGIEAASVAWHPLGWEPAFFSEIDPFPAAVLKHHYSETPNHGDMTKFKEWPSDPAINVLVGGTPCQSFSVAGLRKGLDDPRGNLMLTFGAIAAKYRPTWLVWENVPGVLSSNGGRDFGTFLGMLGQLGYGFAYRVLDAQYFGVPQRRRRVFVVGCLGDWRSAAAVLFERHSLQGHPAPSREAGSAVAALTARGVGTCGADDNQAQAGHLQPVGARMRAFGDYAIDETASTTKARDYKDATDLVVHGTQDPCVGDKAFTLGRNSGQENVLCFAENSRAELRLKGGDGQRTGSLTTWGGKAGQGTPCVAVSLRGREGGATAELGGEQANTLRASSGGGDKPYILHHQVRRLTPVECERLQGFPDGYTAIPWRGKASDQCPDGPRYKALGNSMAVPVMRWIGERIQMISKIRKVA